LLQSAVDPLALKGRTLIGVKGVKRGARVRSPSLVGPLLRGIIDSLTVKGSTLTRGLGGGIDTVTGVERVLERCSFARLFSRPL
jgi:hypothetical protein